MRETYDLFMPLLFQFEGGYGWDPRDPGGPTNWGITQADARRYWKADATPADVKAMPKSEAATIYHDKYNPAVAYDEMPPGTDCVVMDGGVNSGPSRSLRWLAAALGVDSGIAHELAVDAKGAKDQIALIKRQCANRRAFLQRLGTFDHFGPGWMDRVARLEAFACRMWMQFGAAMTPAQQKDVLNHEAGKADQQKKENRTAAGGGVAGGGAAGSQAHQGWLDWFHSLPWWQEAAIVAGGIAIVALIAWCAIQAYQHGLRAKAFRDEAAKATA